MITEPLLWEIMITLKVNKKKARINISVKKKDELDFRTLFCINCHFLNE